ncbi:MAG: hypothetical protein H6733_01755 [Alphaproteobacteria bacterium]|nr:hypothetical protein [Alphaproteobacteria bacterium]
MRGLGAALATVLVGLTSAGCAPSCATVCAKLDRCDLNPTVDKAECELSCEREYNATIEQKLLDNDAPKEVFDDHRRCLGGHSCDEIAAGACYDEALFPFALATPPAE